MADAISAIVTISEIIWTLHEYAVLVKEAQDEICHLSKELFALKGVLEYVDSRKQVLAITNHADAETNKTKNIFSSDEFQSILSSTILHLQYLLTTLQQEPKGRLKRATKRLTWPLRKAEFEEQITKLERAKSWFILAMMTDSLSVPSVQYRWIDMIHYVFLSLINIQYPYPGHPNGSQGFDIIDQRRKGRGT